MNDYVIPHLEWEVMHEPITIPKVDDTKELPEGEKRMVITRNECYNLQAALFTEYLPKMKDRRRCGFAELFEIKGSDSYDRRCILESCDCVGYKKDRVARGRSYEVALSIQGLKIRPKTETESVWLTEWYLNGPKSNRVFRNSTTRKMSKTILRERLAHNDEKIHSIEVSGADPYCTSCDYLRIETGDLQFLIAKAPEGIGPNWSSNIGIEYRKDWGRIPNENEREKIRELCSFVFGRQLLIVGHTSYDEDDNIVEEYACDPWGNDPRYLCSNPDIPAIRIDGHSKADDLITRLLLPYCKRRDDYHLNHALWAYWVARDMPVGMGLPIFAVGVEAMMKKWFKSEKSKSHGAYMTEGEFGEISKNEINNIKTKLRSNYSNKLNEHDCDKIVDYLEKGFRRGVTAQFKFFFDEIDLYLDENEWKAIDARNDVAHGRFIIPRNSEESRRMIRHGFVYKTIIHKILLRLLGYSGQYIDYSDGCKEKPLKSEHDQADAL